MKQWKVYLGATIAIGGAAIWNILLHWAVRTEFHRRIQTREDRFAPEKGTLEFVEKMWFEEGGRLKWWNRGEPEERLTDWQLLRRWQIWIVVRNTLVMVGMAFGTFATIVLPARRREEGWWI